MSRKPKVAIQPTTASAQPAKKPAAPKRTPVRSAKSGLMTMRHLIYEVYDLLKNEWRLFGGLGLLFGLAYRVMVEGVSHVDLTAIQSTAQNSSSSATDQAINTALLTGSALDSASSSPSSQGPMYATLLTIIFALCVVWALRQTLAGRRVRIRDALYNGPAPIFTVLAVLAIIFIQALPLTLGIFIYVATTSGHITQGILQNGAVMLVAIIGALISCYWLSVSLVALMTATVPGIYPMAALRAAKELVGIRRWQIFLRIVLFATVVAMVWALIIVLSLANPLTRIFTMEIFDILRAVTLVLATVFLYKLYRSLVDETAE
ncbi:MAG TPA: hypothetical protein VLF60_03140 [Candidatus Saccharimonadales bacterium]|nr:hypothetical protein [Candidatus Saccharimonadales bacterium]